MTRRWFSLAAVAGAIIIAAAIWFGIARIDRALNPAPETIVNASLQGLREQNRLSAFMASYVAVVTSKQSRFGLTAQKTLIMPGLVRYEVDLARLRQEDVRWDPSAKSLFVTLPPVEVVGPQIDLTKIREYDGGGLLMRLTDAETQLDTANRRAGQVDLLRQARQTVPMTLARDATRRAIQRSFALPLRAAGVEAAVRVRFAGEADFPSPEAVQLDRSKPWREIYETDGHAR